MAGIRFQSIRKIYGKVVASNDISLEIKDGEFMVLLGPSGCGKTTLLRCLAGLEQVDGGRVFIGDRDVTDLAPRDRKIAMVFQSYAVFPHLKVFDNIAFGLKMQGVPKDEIKRRVQEGAELLQLEDYLGRYPAQLSGGQRQRVAVARAIVMKAQVLLMDEPLSNLDALLRLQMRAELKRLHEEIKATTIYVTHDQVEALSLGDRIAVMKNGRIVQCDVPMNIYDYPASTLCGRLHWHAPDELLQGQGAVQRRRSQRDDRRIADLPGRQAGTCPGGKKPTRISLLGIRPEIINLVPTQQANTLQAHVLVVEPLGSHKLLTMKVGSEGAKVSVPPDQMVKAAMMSGCILTRKRSAGWMLPAATPSRRPDPIICRPYATRISSRIPIGTASGISIARIPMPGWCLSSRLLFQMLDKEPGYRFVLDGQTSMIEDWWSSWRNGAKIAAPYLQRLSQYVRQGRVCVGPYYLQPDWQLVSEEALVRNLLIGQQMAEQLGGRMQVGWLLDNFGQISQTRPNSPRIWAGWVVRLARRRDGPALRSSPNLPGKRRMAAR